jgi:hypothetical protein
MNTGLATKNCQVPGFQAVKGGGVGWVLVIVVAVLVVVEVSAPPEYSVIDPFRILDAEFADQARATSAPRPRA